MTSIKFDVDFWKKWNPKEIIYQMAPINFIGNKDKRETVQNHIAFCTSETAKTRKTVPCKLDISYGPHDSQKFDVYGVDLPPDALTFFWVHGGFWRSGDKSWSGCFVKNAYERGFKSVIIDYPLAPEARMVDMCNSVCQALQKSMIMFPGSNFVVGGHSSGAQLVASIFYEIPAVQMLPERFTERVIGAVMMSGAYDMRPVIGIPFINDALKVKEEETEDFSPVLTVDKIHSVWTRNRDRFAFHLLTAENDPPSLKLFAEMYAEMLRNKEFFVEYWISKDDDHFTELENMAIVDSNVSIKILSFLSKVHDKYGTKLSKL